MLATIPKRLALSATGLLLTTGLIVQSQSSEWCARLRDWMPPASPEVVQRGRIARGRRASPPRAASSPTPAPRWSSGPRSPA